MLKRCFWHRFVVFFEEMRSILHNGKIHRGQQLEFLNKLITVFSFTRHIINKESTVDFKCLVSVMSCTVTQMQVCIGRQTNVGSALFKLQVSVENTVHLGMKIVAALQHTPNMAEIQSILIEWGIQNPQLFWRAILQPIHEVYRERLNGLERYDGTFEFDDEFKKDDEIEPSYLKMKNEEIAMLTPIFFAIAERNPQKCLNFVAVLAKSHYEWKQKGSDTGHRWKHFATNSMEILALLEALHIIPDLPSDAVFSETRNILHQDKNYRVREPFEIYDFIWEGIPRYGICLPTGFYDQ